MMDASTHQTAPWSIDQAQSSADLVFKNMVRRIPTGAISAAKGHASSSEDKFPFSMTTVDDVTTVYIPADLEKAADNPLALVACAAIKAMGAHVAFSNKTDGELENVDKKVAMYLSGVSWALNFSVEGVPALHPFQSVTGPMGHGFYHVAHSVLQHKYASSSWAKGQGWSLTKGLTGKAWSDTLSPSTRRIITLVNRACSSIRNTDAWRSYFRPKDSFLGREIKKSLPHMKVGILTQQESDYISLAYASNIQKYKGALHCLDEPNEEILPQLGKLLKDAGTAIQPIDQLVDKIVKFRVTVIYPENKREKKAALKRPIIDLIEEVPELEYIERWDPSYLGGLKPFKVPPRITDESFYEYMLRSRSQYQVRVEQLRAAGRSILADLCETWADATISTTSAA
jgi:hypothetical protein